MAESPIQVSEWPVVTVPGVGVQTAIRVLQYIRWVAKNANDGADVTKKHGVHHPDAQRLFTTALEHLFVIQPAIRPVLRVLGADVLRLDAHQDVAPEIALEDWDRFKVELNVGVEACKALWAAMQDPK